MKSGLVYLCFSTDFLIEEADEWRPDCWQMIQKGIIVLSYFLQKESKDL